jgi:hypothetical protein
VGVEVAFVVVEVDVAFMVAGAAMTAREASARMARRGDVNLMMTECGGWKVEGLRLMELGRYFGLLVGVAELRRGIEGYMLYTEIVDKRDCVRTTDWKDKCSEIVQ